MIENIHINLFYPMLFIVIVILIIAVCSVIKSRNGNMTFKDMFSKSSDNAKDVTIDTTSKMANMHSEVVKAEFTEAHEKEIHYLEDKVYKIETMVIAIQADVDLLLKKISNIEKTYKK